MMKRDLLKTVDNVIMDVWNSNELTNELKNQIVMKLEEANMLIQEGHLNHEDYFRGL
jgi:hypothetical protein